MIAITNMIPAAAASAIMGYNVETCEIPEGKKLGYCAECWDVLYVSVDSTGDDLCRGSYCRDYHGDYGIVGYTFYGDPIMGDLWQEMIEAKEREEAELDRQGDAWELHADSEYQLVWREYAYDGIGLGWRGLVA